MIAELLKFKVNFINDPLSHSVKVIYHMSLIIFSLNVKETEWEARVLISELTGISSETVCDISMRSDVFGEDIPLLF